MRKSVLRRDSAQTQTRDALSHRIKPKAIALAVATCFSAGVASANPTNPTVVHGTASFNQAGNILNITNSHNAIINWGSFSIGINELTKFIQPSALSAVLNRVTGQDPSAILGALQSNGKVFLLNPNGIVFGAGSQINVAGLVASTLNLSNEDFLNNRMRFTDGAGAGSVVNHGSITAGVPDANGNITGGNVYLVGKAVTNGGLITTPKGEVVLAAGNSVELVNPGTPNLRVEIVAPDNEARNLDLGIISAEAGRIGIYAGLIKQSGVINADSAVAEGGHIILKSTKSTALDAGSVTSARGTSGGEIIALSSMSDGITEVAGTMDARGTAGNGGFIETSAAKVNIADSAIVTAAGGGGGKAGTWLIDPTDFYISSAYGGNITGASLASQLNAYGGTDITISTSSYGGDVGNLYVNDAVSWNSGGALTLIAHNNLEVNNAVTNGGVGDINLYAGWDGVSTATPTIGYIGTIQLNAPITTGGGISLVAGGSIAQGAPGSLTADKLIAISNNGSVTLNDPGAVNTVNTIAGSAIGAFQFKNSGNLTIGSITGPGAVGTVNGITVAPGAGRHAMINVEVTGGQLTINNPVYAYGGDGSEGQAGGNATINLTSGSLMQVNNSIVAEGGEGGYSYSGTAGSGGNAMVMLVSGSDLMVNGYVSANGGAGDYGYSGANGGNGGHGKVMMTAVGNLSVQGSISGIGGDGGNTDTYYGGPLGVGGSGGDGIVQLTAGNISGITGSVVARGGWGGDYGYYGGSNGNGGHASVVMNSSSGISLSNTYISADGGEGQISGAGGAAGVTMIAGGNIQIEGGEGGVAATAGSGASNGNAGVAIIAGGNIGITNSSEIISSGGSGSNTPGLGSVIVSAAGDVSLSNGAMVGSSGTAGLFSGANVSLDNAGVLAYSSASVTATGSLGLANGSVIFGGGNAYIKTGGDVTVDESGIIGSPDVFMTVGGVVNINNGGGIAAGAPTTIHLTFPMLTSGGYFINGIEGVVFDPLTGTGFMADGSPAILGTNLLVTYGGGSNLNIPTDALIVAMGESSKPPDPEKDKDVFEDLKKDKDKEAPVCR